MNAQQQKTYDNVIEQRKAYHMGVRGWEIVDFIASFGIIGAGVAAAAVLKLSDKGVNIAAGLALLASFFSALQKKYRPYERLRKDWLARGALHQLVIEMDADPNFDPDAIAKKLSKAIQQHDTQFL